MKKKWEVDSGTVVEADIGGFGKKAISINGTEVLRKRSLRTKIELPFDLSEGRKAMVSVIPQYFGYPDIELRVDGRLMVETGKEAIKCGSCGTVVKPFDRFCTACGHAMPSGEDYVHKKHVKDATGAIKVLAGLFFIFGIIMFFASKAQVAGLLAKLEGMDPASTLPTPINGITYTVATLRDQLIWESWGILIVNMFLAVVMAGLAIWGKRAPLAAVLVATATYAVVIVTNAMIDPATIGQGIFLKIIIIAFLVKGIKAALALRTSNA